jgi:hypothetical protein
MILQISDSVSNPNQISVPTPSAEAALCGFHIQFDQRQPFLQYFWFAAR